MTRVEGPSAVEREVSPGTEAAACISLPALPHATWEDVAPAIVAAILRAHVRLRAPEVRMGVPSTELE